MTTDLDIYRTAQVLIREHGKGAAQEASRRAVALLAKGATKGAATVAAGAIAARLDYRLRMLAEVG